MDIKAFAESGHLAHLDEREEYVTVSVGGRLMSAGGGGKCFRIAYVVDSVFCVLRGRGVEGKGDEK